jgi:glycosyltransferase involved in cell wall biosynthesis
MGLLKRQKSKRNEDYNRIVGINSSCSTTTNKKLKIVWLCYFTNQFVQDKIKPWKRIGEFAHWISSMIKLFENDDSIELHVVSQHRWICGYKSFESKGVTYHFFNPGIPVIGRHWPGFFRVDIWSDFRITKLNFARIVKKINPDIIHMHGAENEFCNAIIQFSKKYPVFITLQGFIYKSSARSKSVNRRVQNENRIITMFKHFGYRTETMGADIKTINKEAVLHWHHYPMQEISPVEADKQFDLVFFARVCKEKGIEDLLEAVAILKKEKPDISLCVIGGGKSDIWKEKAKELGIYGNIYWAGFLPTRKDVHDLASSARISVLPTYHDIISGTIIESLFLKLPVVAYDVGSIHEVNKYEKIITLVERFDINGLAESILRLLNDVKQREERSEKGCIRAHVMFNAGNDKTRSDLLKAYTEVINDFQANLTSISKL